MSLFQQACVGPHVGTNKTTRNDSEDESTSQFQMRKQQMKKKFNQALRNRRMNLLRANMVAFYGKNYPLNYKDYYQFEQKWENQPDINKKGKKEYLKFHNKFESLIYILITVFNSLGIWLGTIDIFIQEQGAFWFRKTIYGLALIAQTIHFLQIANREKQKRIKVQFKNILKSTYFELFVIVFFTLKVSQIHMEPTFIRILLQSLILVFLYIKMSRNYNSFRVINFSRKYQYHFKVVDLILNLLMISHIMALVLYSSTKAGFQHNWINKYGLETSQQFLYSFYFATITVLTVGYGDISPANPVQVLIVTLVQICGIIMLAYVINEIGFCLSSLRKKYQILERDFQIVDKLKNYYKLNEDVVYRVNEYLINSNQKSYDLTPQEEEGLVNKLNQQLRNEVSQLNHLSIVKSSIFLVCRWSKAMQNAVAMKLQHTLFSPNNTIYQPPGKERIYLIKSGLIGVYAATFHLKKQLKIISTDISKLVSDNCYGYSAALSQKKIRLQAIAKQFTSAYFIDKVKFLQCALEKISDFQYYHQIKNKLENQKIPEVFEVPLLQSNRHHYNPSKIYTISKYVAKKSTTNKRKFYVRKDFGQYFKSFFQQNIQKKIGRKISVQNQQSFRISSSLLDLCSQYKNTIFYPTKQFQQQFSSKTDNIISKTDIMRVSSKKSGEIAFYKQNLQNVFQVGKEFTNYLIKYNKTNVAKPLFRYYGGFKKNIQILQKIILKQIISDIKQHLIMPLMLKQQVKPYDQLLFGMIY